LTERDRFALVTSRIVYMHDPTRSTAPATAFCAGAGVQSATMASPQSAALVTQEVFGVCGAACMMPKTVFEELGGFDEDFFASHEDVDLSYRARLRGYRCRYVADAVVRHVGSATLGTVSPFSVFHGQRNLEWVYFKDTPASLLWKTLPGHIVYDVAAGVHFARSGMLGPYLRAKAGGRGPPAAHVTEACRRSARATGRCGCDCRAARDEVVVDQNSVRNSSTPPCASGWLEK
jgi:GT2 family glycosyltransferase